MGLIGQRLDLGPGAVGDHTGTAEMIPVPVVHSPIRDRDRRNANVIGPDEPAATRSGAGRLAFIQLTDIPGRSRAHNLLYPSPITVIDKGRGGSGNSDSVISGSLASPKPPSGGQPKERGDETYETESRNHL